MSGYKRIILILVPLVLTACNNTHLKHINDEESGHQYIVITEDFKQGLQVIHDPGCYKCKTEKKNENQLHTRTLSEDAVLADADAP